MLKKIFLFLYFIFVCSFVNAQDAVQARDFFYIIEDFSGLLNTHTSKYLLPEKNAQQALNVRPNKTYGSLAKRSKMLLLTTTPDAAIKSLYRYYKTDDSVYTIATYGTTLDAYDDDATQYTLFENGTSSARWKFVTYKDKLIGVNGTDENIKWDGKILVTANTDGARTDGDLVSDLGAPFAELDTGTDLDASSWYQYKVAFCHDDVCTDSASFTYSNARSNPILTGAAVYNIALTDVPLGPSGTTKRIIYRTVGNASRAAVVADTSFYQVDEIADNSTTTFSDTDSDADILADPAPTWATVSGGTNVTPPKTRLAEIHASRLFLANEPSQALDGKSSLYWSDILNPDYFNYNTDYALIRPDDGDEITFLHNLLGVLTIGKTRTINKFYTTATSSTNWTISDPFSHLGCIGIYSTADSPMGIVYLSRYGLRIFNGQNSTLISDAVTENIEDILDTNLEEVVGIFHDNRYLLSYTSESSGSTKNNRVLVFDFIREAWYEDSKNIDSFVKFDSGNDFGTLYSGSSDTDGNIYAHESDFSTLTYRYKSQFDGGTTDSIFVAGTEKDPWITLGDNTAWEDLGAGTWENSGDWTWLLHDLTGYWYSAGIQINASELDQIYWNENLGDNGDVEVSIRLAATEAGLTSASWSSAVSDPSGSDVSGVSANVWIQFRVKLTSTVYIESPTMFLQNSFVLKMTYKKEGTTGESSILSIWEGGITRMGGGENPKRIKEIQVFYESDSTSTMTVTATNEQGDSWSFDIDLSVDPDDSSTDSYFGTTDNRIYVYIPAFDNVPIGRHWTYKVEEDGTETWTVSRIVVRGDINAYTTYK